MISTCTSAVVKSIGYQLSGDYKFHIEITTFGDPPYQNSSVFIKGYTQKDLKNELPIKVKWAKEIDDRSYYIKVVPNNEYHISPLDLGFSLEAKIKCLDGRYKGLAILKYGPIILHPETRNELQSVSSLQKGQFYVNYWIEEQQKDNQQNINEIFVEIIKEKISFTVRGSGAQVKKVQIDYNLDSPLIEILNSNSKCLNLVFRYCEELVMLCNFFNLSPLNISKIGLQFVTREQRDLFCLSLKCFSVKKNLIDYSVINDIEKAEGKLIMDDTEIKKAYLKNSLDINIELITIKTELKDILAYNQKLKNEKQDFIQQISRLENELKQTINTYTNIIINNNINTNNNQINNIFDKNLQKLSESLYSFGENTSLKQPLFTMTKQPKIPDNNDNLNIFENEYQKNQDCLTSLQKYDILDNQASFSNDFKSKILMNQDQINTKQQHQVEEKVNKLQNQVQSVTQEKEQDKNKILSQIQKFTLNQIENVKIFLITFKLLNQLKEIKELKEINSQLHLDNKKLQNELKKYQEGQGLMNTHQSKIQFYEDKIIELTETVKLINQECDVYKNEKMQLIQQFKKDKEYLNKTIRELDEQLYQEKRVNNNLQLKLIIQEGQYEQINLTLHQKETEYTKQLNQKNQVIDNLAQQNNQLKSLVIKFNNNNTQVDENQNVIALENQIGKYKHELELLQQEITSLKTLGRGQFEFIDEYKYQTNSQSYKDSPQQILNNCISNLDQESMDNSIQESRFFTNNQNQFKQQLF